MSATDNEFYAAFAARVRTQLAANAPEGDATMNTTTAHPNLSATFQAAPDAGQELSMLLAMHDAQMVEGDLGEGISGWAARVNGRITLVLPAGQDPAERLETARREITRLSAIVAAAPCDTPWCTETNAHINCYSRPIALPVPDAWKPTGDLLSAYMMRSRGTGTVTLHYGRTDNDERAFRAGDDLRAETARVRAHLARLDALADQYDAIAEAEGTETLTTTPGTGEHFPWCEPGACIDHATMATEHQGALNVLPETRDRSGEPIGFSRLFFCPDDDDAHVQISATFRGKGTAYTPAEADALIGDVEAFLTGLKAQRAKMGAQPAPAPERTCSKHAWCVEEDRGEADAAHAGPMVTLAVPEFELLNTRRPDHLLQVQLWATETGPSAAPHAYLAIDDTGESSRMNAGQLAAFADQLATFHQQVQGMAAQLRQDEGAR